MNILYLAPFLPSPPDKGERIRAFHLIRHLAREHTVHLACLVGSPAELDAAASLGAHCASVDAVYLPRAMRRLRAAVALLGGGLLYRSACSDQDVGGLSQRRVAPFSVAAAEAPRLRRAIARRLEATSVDAIVVFSSSMAGYVSDVSSVPKVVDFVDLDSELWRLYARHHRGARPWMFRREAVHLARHEDAVARAFGHCVFVSDAEAAAFRARAGNRPVSVIENGVDLEYFAGGGDVGASARSTRVVFTGAMDYVPNVDAVDHFCRRILPLVRASLPQVTFAIVGRDPGPAVARLARAPGVTVTGAVPDVRPYLAGAAVAVAPFRLARGVQNKILEAMAMGVPVVGTRTAFEGLHATEEDGVAIVDEPEAFARAVVGLLRDPERRRGWGRQARAHVERHHRWADHGARLEALLRSLAGTSRRATAPPGRGRAPGGVGGHVGAPHVNR